MHDKLGDFITFIYIAVPLLILVLGVWTWWDKRKEKDSKDE
jgi:membrane protein DedA with SNARE-associated domain